MSTPETEYWEVKLPMRLDEIKQNSVFQTVWLGPKATNTSRDLGVTTEGGWGTTEARCSAAGLDDNQEI